MKCPACGHPLAGDAIECTACGVIVAKFRRKTENMRVVIKRPRMSGLMVFVALAIPIALLALAAYLLMR